MGEISAARTFKEIYYFKTVNNRFDFSGLNFRTFPSNLNITDSRI